MDSHPHKYLMEFLPTNCKKLVALKVWTKPEERKEDDRLLTFVTKIKQEISDLKTSKEEISLVVDSRGVSTDSSSWKFNSTRNQKTMNRNRIKFYWCEQDCHRNPM